MADAMTWYDVLGILPGAAPGGSAFCLSGTGWPAGTGHAGRCPSTVLKAADAAQAAVDAAWRVLGDPPARRRYDQEIGARPAGGGLDRPPPVPSGAGADPVGGDVTADMVLAALADVMTAHPAPPRRVTVPDLRGLFVRPALRAAGALGLHLDMIQLTAQPMPVEGLVVDQSPRRGRRCAASAP